MSDRRHVVVSYDCLPAVGGAHTWLYEVYRRWPAPVSWFTRAYSTSVKQADEQRAFDAMDHGSLRIFRSAVPLQEINVAKPRFIAAMFQHMRELARVGGREVVLHNVRSFPEGFTSLLYKRLYAFGAKLITYAHGEEILIARQSRQLEKMARTVYTASDLVIANSENTRRILAEFAPSARVICIHPGVDAAAFPCAEDAIARYRASLGWSPDTKIVATIARMEKRKNQAGVIRAVAALRSRGRRIGYICAGDGEEKEALEQLAQALSVADHVKFPGRISESEKKLIFASCDVHAMPSIQVDALIEGFGMVFIEAAAAGTPSIAGASGGQAEAVRDGVTGLIVDGNHVDPIADAIARIAYEPDLRRAMSDACLHWAREHDWSEVLEKTHEQVLAITIDG